MSSGITKLRMEEQPSGPEVVCLADELASTLAVMKSLCVLNKSAGIGPAALASVGLGLDNQDCRIKTRGRNTRVILLARIPSALLACLPQSGGGESESKESDGSGGRADQSSTGNNNVEAKARQLCMQVSFAPISIHYSACMRAFRNLKYVCVYQNHLLSNLSKSRIYVFYVLL